MLMIDENSPWPVSDQRSLAAASAASRGYMSRGLLRKDQIRQSAIYRAKPAMCGWCLEIIDRDEGATLPRGIARRTSI